MNLHHPKRRRILLAATGLSPQVLTETLYALCIDSQPAWIPDEIHLITSREGAERARLALLDPADGQFHAFCKDFGLAGKIAFLPEHIHRIHDDSDHALSDIRTPQDNAHAADSIHALVRELTAQPDTELHVSIAGGRKTMGFYLGYCLSLAARPQDTLSHVLVSEPFESLPDFYYPPATPRLLHTRDGRPIHTADARVMLANIPFVRLRTLLPAAALAPELSFSQAVQATQTHLEKPHLRLGVNLRQLHCRHRSVQLPPQLFAWYLWLAERCRANLPPVRYTDADPSEFLACYARIVSRDAADWETTAALLADGFTKEFFEQKRTKTNVAIKRALGLNATPYLIAGQGKRPLTRYALMLSSDEVEIY
jgi:CRISPR-associated protein (TIGR02584 family)